jgi:hypothetical protein
MCWFLCPQVGAALALILVKPRSELFHSSLNIQPSEKLEPKDLGYAVVLYLWLLVRALLQLVT